jgi:hypothetical protein
MDVKQMIVIPIYWGEWWLPVRNNAYSWIELNGLLTTIIGGRYMDGLNQYGFGRGSVAGEYVFQEDPPATGFGDTKQKWMFKTAIDEGHVPRPDDYDLATQQPFYALMVKPGVEHLRDASADGKVPQDAPDVGTGAYHFGFSYDLGGGKSWGGQACWVKSGPTAVETLGRLVHEMAEAYSGHAEISDRCQAEGPALVDGVPVPRYWSEADNECWPPSDRDLTVQEALAEEPPRIGDPRLEPLQEGFVDEGPHTHLSH